MKPQAIETAYKGYRFRSRLEARWAVFFDAMGIEWDYELEGFHNGKNAYLPDFFLPQVDMWAEVKPTELSKSELNKVKICVAATGQPVLLLIGLPACINYYAVEIDTWNGEPAMGYDYTLIMKMIVKGERRFPCANFLPSGYESSYPPRYRDAVSAAKSARFEHGEQPWTTLHTSNLNTTAAT